MGPIDNHVFAFSESEEMEAPGRVSFLAGFVLKNSEFLPGELEQIRRILKGSGLDTPKLKILYAPDEKPTDSLCTQIVSATHLDEVLRNNDSLLAPAMDDKPFFNQHTRWSRIRWRTVVDLFSQQKPLAARMALEDRPIAEVTLLILFVQSTIVAGLCILLPLALLNRTGLRVEGSGSWLGYFAVLGLGFIMVEIALLQRFLLFLGQPIYTYAVVLAGLLIFTGVGSYAAGKFGPASLKRVLLRIVLLVPIMALITPVVFQVFLGLGIFWRIAVSLLLMHH
jgi:hypothetical protein